MADSAALEVKMANYTSCKVIHFIHMNTHCYIVVSGDSSFVMVIQNITCHKFMSYLLLTMKKGKFLSLFSSKHIARNKSGTLETQFNFATRSPIQVILNFMVQGKP